MSLLLPALRKAKEKTNQIHCANNMKQLSLGLSMYAQDYNGWIMTPKLLNHTSTSYRYWHTLMWTTKHVPNRDIYYCPASQCPNFASDTSTWGFYSNTLGMITFRFINGIQPYNAANRGNILYRIPGPTRWPIITDSFHTIYNQPHYMVATNTPDFNSRCVQLRHANHANVLFIDGHTGYHDKNDFEEEIAPFMSQYTALTYNPTQFGFVP
jgi:prepilin-type processing-associated H-X9-DG protein